MVNLVVACGPLWVTGSDIGLHDLKHLRKGIVERMMCVLGRSGLRVVSLSPCFRGERTFLTGAHDSNLQTVTIPEAAYIQLRRRPPEDEQGNARNM